MGQTLLAGLLLMSAASAVFSGRAEVVDGDTLRVGTETVRLSGVDAPELSQRCGPSARQTACGALAARWLRARLGGGHVICREVDRDRYERRVAVCRLAGDDVGASMVEAGWATAYRRYSGAYVDAEGRARAARRGIWATGFETPADYRRERRATTGAQPPPDPRCAIKGNINAKGVRIYHQPGSRDYPAVRVDQAKGERWFCSAFAAAAAGWRAAR
jgi:endonuclease YncB( thermonuclease family)